MPIVLPEVDLVLAAGVAVVDALAVEVGVGVENATEGVEAVDVGAGGPEVSKRLRKLYFHQFHIPEVVQSTMPQTHSSMTCTTPFATK